MKVKSGVAMAMLAGWFGVSSLAVASSVDQLQYLVNRDAGWVKQQLAHRGFAKRAESDSDDAQYWWSERDQLCVKVTFDDEVESIDRVAHDECHVSGSEEGGWRRNSWNNRREHSEQDREDNGFRYGHHHHGFDRNYGNNSDDDNRDDDNRDNRRYGSHRYENHDRYDSNRGDDSGVSEEQMSRYCQGEAASKFGQRPQDIITDSAERSGNSYEVNGKYPQQGYDITFSCSFSRDGQFRGVRRTN